jgi:ketosteroid isomerase-like protein
MITRVVLLVALMATTMASNCSSQETGLSNAELEKKILALESERDQAMIKGDIPTLDRIFADDYFWISVNGSMHVKAERLSDLRSGSVKYESFKQENYKLYVYPNTVVMTGRAVSPVHVLGRINNNPRQFTNVYVKQAGEWRLVVHQSTPIVDEFPKRDQNTAKEAGRDPTNPAKSDEKESLTGEQRATAKEVLKVEEEKDDAMKNHDMATLNRIFADDLTFTNAKGKVLTKSERMEEIRSGSVKNLTSDKGNYILHFYGNTVILTARENSVVEYHGTVINSPRRYVTCYVKINGQWKYVAHQATLISEHYFDSLPKADSTPR